MSSPIFRAKPLERRKLLRALPAGIYVAVDYLPARHMDARTVVGELVGYGWLATGMATDSLVIRPGRPTSTRWVLQVLLATSLVRVQNVHFNDAGNATTGLTLAGPEHPDGERLIHSPDFAGFS